MKIIAKHAEDVEQDHPTANNNAASAESARSNASATTGSDGDRKKPHGFSNSLAQLKNDEGETLGWNGAIILRYLSYLARKYGKAINGKLVVRVNLDHISKQYPYMGRSTVDENVCRLEEFGFCEIANLNSYFKRPKYDRTRCYHIPRKWMDAAEEELRYFDPAIATLVKVPAAVVYYNFSYWMNELKSGEVEEPVPLRPSLLEEVLPFDKSTIKRAIKALIVHGLIQGVPGKQCCYVVGNNIMRGANPDESGAKADKGGAKADESGSNPDNDNSFKQVIGLLKTCSKEKPAAPSLEHSSPVTVNTNETFSSLQIIPDTDGQNVVEHDKKAPCFTSSASPSISASYRKLHITNGIIDEYVSSLPKDVQDKLQDTVLLICCSFLKNQAESTIQDWNFIDEGEELFQVIAPEFTAFLHKTFPSIVPSNPFYPLLLGGTLEVIIGAFLWDKNRSGFYSHPIEALQRLCYRIQLMIFKCLEALRAREMDEEFAAMRQEFASPDRDKESDAILAPAEKMRVFRNALDSRNKVGWIFYDGSHRTEQIQFKHGLGRIQKLFELNPSLTPAVLLKVMDGCMEMFSNQPAPPKRFQRDANWHARHGYDIQIFASYLKTIVKQLGIKSPVNVFLSDDKKCVNQVAEEEGNLAA